MIINFDAALEEVTKADLTHKFPSAMTGTYSISHNIDLIKIGLDKKTVNAVDW
jgi:hypothetical protein